MHNRITLSSLLAVLLLLATALPVSAHQPFFEDSDLTAVAPYTISDISISLAFYGTLEKAGDVDYFVFDGKAGQAVFLSLVIPEIEGQETFTPTLALMGPGLSKGKAPKPVSQPKGSGVVLLRAANAEPMIFFEPFGMRNYYERQEQTITLPSDGRYTVALWSESSQIGRYTFSPGKREVWGGDSNYRSKSQQFWTPVAKK